MLAAPSLLISRSRWTPLRLPSIRGFIDFERSDLMTVSGGLISSITDAVSGVAFTQATEASRPGLATGASGRPVSTYDGTADCLEYVGMPTGWPTGAAASEIWVIVDQKRLAANTTGTIAASYGGASNPTCRRCERVVSSGVSRARTTAGNGTGTDTLTLSTVNYEGRHVARSIFRPTSITTEVNGVSAAGSAAPATGTVRARIGASELTSAGGFWEGDISAVLVIAGVLSSIDAGRVYQWARGRV